MCHFTDLRFAVPIFSWFADLYFLDLWFFGPKFFSGLKTSITTTAKRFFKKDYDICFKGLLYMPVSDDAHQCNDDLLFRSHCMFEIFDILDVAVSTRRMGVGRVEKCVESAKWLFNVCCPRQLGSSIILFYASSPWRKYPRRRTTRGCRLSGLTNSALAYEPNCEGKGISAIEYRCKQEPK